MCGAGPKETNTHQMSPNAKADAVHIAANPTHEHLRVVVVTDPDPDCGTYGYARFHAHVQSAIRRLSADTQ